MVLLENKDLTFLQEMKEELQQIRRLLQIQKPSIKEYFDTSETMRLMGWSRNTLQRFLKDTPTAYVKVRGRVMVRKSALDALTEKGGLNG
jgi:hypothetical protein